MQQVDHRPEMAPFLDVDLKEVSQIVHARAPLAEPSLLLDARRFGVTLRDDQPPQLIAELTRHFVPDWLPEEVAETDAPIVNGIGEEYSPAVLGQLHVLEVRPAGRIDAHG